MSSEYLNHENHEKKNSAKMNIFVCFFACWIVEISGGKTDDMCADQGVLVTDLQMPHQHHFNTTILRYKAEHGKLSRIFFAVYYKCVKCI